MRSLSDIGWHLIAELQACVDAGIERLEVRGDQLWVVPVRRVLH